MRFHISFNKCAISCIALGTTFSVLRAENTSAREGLLLQLHADEAKAEDLTDSSPVASPVEPSGSVQMEKGIKNSALSFDGKSHLLVRGAPELNDKLAEGDLYIGCYLYRENEGDGGLFLKREGSFVLGTLPGDHSQIHFGVWDREKGYVSVEAPNGSLKASYWQHVAATANEKEMAIFVDGKKVASGPGVNRTSGTGPVSIGVGLDLQAQPTQAPLRGKLDEIEIRQVIPNEAFFNLIAAEQTEDFRSTLVSISRPPLQKPAIPIVNPMSPRIHESDKKARLENSFLTLGFDLKEGIALSEFANNYIGSDCLVSGELSPVFYMAQGNERFDSRDFRVTKTEIIATTEHKKFLIEAELPDRKLTAILQVKIDGGPETEWSLSFVNTSSVEASLIAGFPFLGNIQVGTDLEENYYFFPFHSGWVGKAPFSLSSEYGTRSWLPTFDVSNPTAGGGIYTWPKDPNGKVKRMLLRKTRADGSLGTDYNMIRMRPVEPFTDEKGVSLGVFWDEQKIAPKSTFALPEAAVGVHGGTAVDSLKRYAKWAHTTWYKHDPMPDSLKRDFQFVAVLHDGGNQGFTEGLLGKSPGKGSKWIASNQIQPGREDNHLQFAMWWHHPSWGTDPDNGWGDYYYNEDAGGAEALAAEIKRCQDKGSRVSLYLCSRALGPNTNIGRAHAKEWGYMYEPNTYATDWGALNFCTHVHEWQDYLGQVYARVMKDLKPDGLYLDTSAEILRCKNPLHPHAEELAEDQVRLLKVIRNAIKDVNPQAIFMVEFCGSDYFSQFVDASWVQTWAHPLAKNFNDYDLCYFRFVFPQVKLAEWGQSADTFHIDSKRALFNGIGIARGDLRPEQTAQLAPLVRLMRENGDAFSDLHPEALVATLADNVYANKFPTAAKTAYTVYNKNSEPFSGPVLAVESAENRHYIDATTLTELDVISQAGMTRISATIAAYDVACILDLPTVLKVTQGDSAATVSFEGQPDGTVLKAYTVRGSDLVEVLMKPDGSQWTASLPEGSSGGKLVLKLFHNDFLIDQRICTFSAKN